MRKTRTATRKPSISDRYYCSSHYHHPRSQSLLEPALSVTSPMTLSKYLNSLHLGFLIYRMGTSQNCEDKMRSSVKTLSILPGTRVLSRQQLRGLLKHVSGNVNHLLKSFQCLPTAHRVKAKNFTITYHVP